MKEEAEEVSKKVKIVNGEDSQAAQACTTSRKLYKMRTNIDIEMIKKRTITGHEL